MFSSTLHTVRIIFLTLISVTTSEHSAFFYALVGHGCFRSPGTSSRSSTSLSGSYSAVLQFQHYFFPLLWSFITAFHSAAIVKLIFENFSITNLKVEIVRFHMVTSLRKLITLKGFYRKTKWIALIHGHLVYMYCM